MLIEARVGQPGIDKRALRQLVILKAFAFFNPLTQLSATTRRLVDKRQHQFNIPQAPPQRHLKPRVMVFLQKLGKTAHERIVFGGCQIKCAPGDHECGFGLPVHVAAGQCRRQAERTNTGLRGVIFKKLQGLFDTCTRHKLFIAAAQLIATGPGFMRLKE